MERYLTGAAKKRAWWEIPTGALSAFVGAVAVDVLVEDLQKGLSDPVIELLAYGTVLALVLAPLYAVVRRALRRRWAQRIAKTLAERGRAAVPIDELDKVTGVKNAVKKLRALLDRGYLQRMAFSEDGMMLLVDDLRDMTQAEAPAPQESGDVIAQIRALNDAIDDPGVSAQIERIEALTASILDTVRQRPERADDARRFVNYYLPVTMKLLESYRLMEKQSYQGQTIQASRVQIEAALKKVVFAIEQQQDRLFRSEAMDVDAEISVLETMMRSDGTVEQGIGNRQ